MNTLNNMSDKQIADLAGLYGEFSPSVFFGTGKPQFHAGLPGVIKFARALLKMNAQNQPHPDTVRLNHIIEHDRCRIGLMYETTASEGVVEQISFIFENPTCDTGPDAVHAAIDRSIKARELCQGDAK